MSALSTRSYIVITIVLAAIYAEFRFEILRRKTASDVPCVSASDGLPPAAAALSVGGTGAGTATSGKLFKGEKVHTFDRKQLQFSAKSVKAAAAGFVPFTLHPLKCDKWSVVTTIFEPSEAVKKQAHLQGWCLVVVGDKKGPLKYDIDAPQKNVVFLTAAMQEDLAKHFPLVGVTPWSHFGRKNIGYLYAVLHGAALVWDFDDDNLLLSKHHMFDHISRSINASAPGPTGAGAGATAATAAATASAAAASNTMTALEPLGYSALSMLSFNPYPLMGAPSAPCWPRGLPLQDIKFNASQVALKPKKIPIASVGIIQSLANHDPDVDAIYRLTQPLPFDFPSRGSNVGVPKVRRWPAWK